MFALTDVIKNLLLLNIIVFLLVHFVLRDWNLLPYFTLFPINSPQFEPYQIVSHMFMHGNFQHIIFNMLALLFLGPMVEQVLGAKRFLSLYLLSGLMSAAAHLLIDGKHPAVGASGAVMGVVIAFATMFPNVRLMVFPLPIPVRAAILAIIYVSIDLILGVNSANTGVAHFAHLGGAVTGFTLIMKWGLAGLR